jgi:ParB-like chromosome segregation protein Spo0J
MIKKQLDYTMAGSPVNKPSTDTIREIADTQIRLTDWMKKNIPGYEKALDDYTTASRDITEMKIGQKAADVLAQPIGAKERGAQLARVIDDEVTLLKQTSGFTRKELSEQLKPENMAKLQKVIDDLDIDARFQEQAARGMRGERVSSAVGTPIELPHFLNNVVVLVNNAIRKFAGGGQTRTLKELAEILSDPSMTAEVMKRASQKEQNAIKFLIKAQQTGAIVGPAVMETAE